MSDKSSIKYRPDIDGLRAIAVLLVVLFHLSPRKFQFGFIGVDIFFVISGYLITSIINNDLNLQNFSILQFYIKRTKRIFPALLIVLIITIALGLWLLDIIFFKREECHFHPPSARA